MKPLLKIFTLALLISSATFVKAQQFVGFYNTAFSGSPAVPAYTVGPFAMKTSTGANPNTGALSVTAAYSDQQFGNNAGGLTGFDDKGLMFGISNNNSDKIPTPASVFVQMANVGSPVGSYYSALETTIGTGLSTFNNYAFNMFASAEGISGTTNGRYYMGKVTFTFSRPVANPIIHVTGLGGFLSINEPPYPTLPFAVDMELENADYTLQRLSGTSRTQLDAATKKIYNSFDYQTDYVQNGRTPEGGNYAGTGSFKINGVNVFSVTFRLYLRGMVAGQVWTSNSSYANSVYNGDRFNVSFTLPTQPESPLPVSGVNLKAALSGNDVALTWKTYTEADSKEFEIERSTDGANFTKIATKAAAGNSASELSYAHTDAAMTQRVYFYRLKMIDVDGSYKYSNVAVVRKAAGNISIKAFPNPFTSQLNIEFSKAKGSYVVSLINQAGQEVRSVRSVVENDVQYVTIARGALTAGSYAVRITNIATGEVKVEKVMIQ
ncbi:T9SS type A sorting domain-containing protein [Lacibacter luteus]|uniref:T9SS type A sorting domain-containing protein n=1 Tax=Lacibacter luteus TaxID=2508719 RepID=A0A4Q1CPA9_9BACT|nr:T9SS type A sorting domain-containing protein [Lacibacter luteus]RXK62479.1 T9SS type A sorting domain-containing protein [Lacibacter luteus]